MPTESNGVFYRFAGDYSGCWHLDLGPDAQARLVTGLAAISQGAKSRLILDLSPPVPTVIGKSGQQKGRRAIVYQRLRFAARHDEAQTLAISAVRNLGKPEETEEDVGVVPVDEFVRASEMYLAGKWDFSCARILFWPYTGWAERAAGG